MTHEFHGDLYPIREEPKLELEDFVKSYKGDNWFRGRKRAVDKDEIANIFKENYNHHLTRYEGRNNVKLRR